jgi:hypothetical protein
MAYSTLAVTAPHATAYDSSYPTRSTENYAHGLHEILQDMEDVGPWYVQDGVPGTSHWNVLKTKIYDMIDSVFELASDAITAYRTTGDPALPTKAEALVSTPYRSVYPKHNAIQMQVWVECQKMIHKIYYLWETEDDPLLLKEKLQELLISWPLTDTEVILNEEGGQSLHVVPAWKNVDI